MILPRLAIWPSRRLTCPVSPTAPASSSTTWRELRHLVGDVLHIGAGLHLRLDLAFEPLEPARTIR